MATQRICSIPDCGKEVHVKSRGWCSMHYSRWWEHGDPLLLKQAAKGEPIRYFREVVLAYEGDECLPWPFGKTTAGYGKIGNEYVHRMVCEETKGPPPTPKHEAAHSCGNGHLACCTKEHLNWKTHKDNQADKLLHGTHLQGSRQNGAKLTECEVRKIRVLKGTVSQRGLAEMFGVNRSTVGEIHRGEIWSWLD